MTEEIAKLVLRVDSLEAKNATDAVNKLARAGENTERSMNKMGKSIGIGIAAVAAAIGVAATAMIRNTIDAESKIAQLDARIKSTGGAAGLTSARLQEMAKGLQAVTVFSDEAIMESQALMLTFTKVGNEVFPKATEAALNMSTALGTDLQAATLQLGKALNDPVKGIAALSRAGVQFTVEQKKVIKSMVETGDVVGAQKMILKELETQMGNAARAARETLGGAIAGLKNAFGELLEGDTKGDGVRGATDAINQLTETMNDPDVQRGAQQIVGGIISITAEMVTFISRTMEATSALREYFAANSEKGKNSLVNKRNDLEGKLFATQRRSGQGLSDANDPISKMLGLASGKEGKIKAIKAEIAEIDGLLAKMDERANKPKPPSAAELGVREDKDRITYAPSGGGGSGASDKAAARAAASAAKARAADFASLKDSLAEEEEAIEASYMERSRIIAENTTVGSEEQKKYSQRSSDLRAEELAELKESRGQALEELRMALRSEEQALEESYIARMKIVEMNTAEGSALRAQMSEKVKAEYEEEKQMLLQVQEDKLNVIREGYFTEEEEMRAYHERRKKEILDAAFKTEQERQALLRREEERFKAEQQARESARIQQGLAATSSFLSSMGQLMAIYGQKSDKDAKKRWKMAQNFALASAVVSTAAGVAKGLEKGFPVGWLEAAAAGAAGAVQIATIKSQQYQGAYDQGGQIAAGKYGMVGENGPEFVRGPATVTGRELTKRAMAGASGGGVNATAQVNVYMDAGGKTTKDSANGNTDFGRELGNIVAAKVQEELINQSMNGGILWRQQNG